MGENKEIIKTLSEHLFWDVNVNEIDIKQHARFITERIVTRGNLNDFRLLLKIYPVKIIIKNIIEIRSLDKKTISFLSLYFNVSKNQFRCYN